MKIAGTFSALASITIAAGCASSAATTFEGMPSGDLVLRAVGSGNWSVDCTATSERGRPAARDMSGRGGESFDVIALRGMVIASCSVEAGDAPLTLTLEEAGMDCPFGEFSNGICRTVIGAGESASFEFSPS